MTPEAMLQLVILILTLSMFFVMHNLRNQTTHARTRTRNNKNRQPPNQTATWPKHRASWIEPPDPPPNTPEPLSSKPIKPSPSRPGTPPPTFSEPEPSTSWATGPPPLRSLDSALSAPAAKSLSTAERADALVTRAELKVEINRRRRVDSAVKDLVEAVGLSGVESVNSAALCLLGKCYEWKGMKEEAKEAFQKVLDVEPDSVEARTALDRLGP